MTAEAIHGAPNALDLGTRLALYRSMFEIRSFEKRSARIAVMRTRLRAECPWGR